MDINFLLFRLSVIMFLEISIMSCIHIYIYIVFMIIIRQYLHCYTSICNCLSKKINYLPNTNYTPCLTSLPLLQWYPLAPHTRSVGHKSKTFNPGYVCIFSNFNFNCITYKNTCWFRQVVRQEISKSLKKLLPFYNFASTINKMQG